MNAISFPLLDIMCFGGNVTVVVVDEKGRIYIPSEIRRALGIRKGTRLRIHVEDDKIVLTIEKDMVKFVERRSEWGKEAFLDAGEALASE